MSACICYQTSPAITQIHSEFSSQFQPYCPMHTGMSMDAVAAAEHVPHIAPSWHCSAKQECCHAAHLQCFLSHLCIEQQLALAHCSPPGQHCGLCRDSTQTRRCRQLQTGSDAAVTALNRCDSQRAAWQGDTTYTVYKIVVGRKVGLESLLQACANH